MTDLEITKLCAEAMGLPVKMWCEGQPYASWILFDKSATTYQPLHSDAQAMALVKKFKIQIAESSASVDWVVGIPPLPVIIRADLNRAICECVAKMQSSK